MAVRIFDELRSKRKARGTDVILHIDKDSKEFLEEAQDRSASEKILQIPAG